MQLVVTHFKFLTRKNRSA